MLDVPESFAPGGLVLRKPRLTDASSIYRQYAQDPDTCRFLVWRPHRDVGDTRAFLEECERNWASGIEWTWCILDPLDPEAPAVGMVACRHRGHLADLGYVLAPRLWNRGIMTTAVGAVVKWLQGMDGMYRIWAVCDVANVASARVLSKVGMTREGTLRRWMIHPNISMEPRDCFVHSWVR
jgi:RimJ/RimL family protein N-acetyltransferase